MGRSRSPRGSAQHRPGTAPEEALLLPPRCSGTAPPPWCGVPPSRTAAGEVGRKSPKRPGEKHGDGAAKQPAFTPGPPAQRCPPRRRPRSNTTAHTRGPRDHPALTSGSAPRRPRQHCGHPRRSRRPRARSAGAGRGRHQRRGGATGGGGANGWEWAWPVVWRRGQVFGAWPKGGGVA